jgi:aryl sulfotransferase
MTSANIQYPQKVREHPYHFLDSTIWNDFRFRNDDIIIGSYSKSGTTWAQQIVAQLAGIRFSRRLTGWRKQW